MLDAVVAWLGPLGAGVATAGTGPGPLSGAYPCYAVYAAADGAFLAVGALEPPFWVASAGRSTGRTWSRASSTRPRSRRSRRSWPVGRAPSGLPSSATSACVAPVNVPGEAERDPQVRARGLVVGRARRPTSSRSAAAAAWPATADGQRPPGLGDDTLDVLAAAGYAADEVATLEAAGDRGRAGHAGGDGARRRLGTALARLATRARPDL